MDTASHGSQTGPRKNAAERIRPILQAMEASINSARRNRVKEASPITMPSVQRQSIVPSPAVLQPPMASAAPDSSQRLKAKPKRLNSPFVSAFEQPNYRSQAG